MTTYSRAEEEPTLVAGRLIQCPKCGHKRLDFVGPHSPMLKRDVESGVVTLVDCKGDILEIVYG